MSEWPNGHFRNDEMAPEIVRAVTLRSSPSDIIVGFITAHGNERLRQVLATLPDVVW